MCTPIVGQLTVNLVQSYIENGHGVSFKGLGRKWDTESDVKDVVEKIRECNNLKYLELEGNTLGVDAAKAIGKVLESKPELEAALWKDLFTSRLKNEIPQAMKFLFAGVDLASARLQYLDLSDNAIGPLGMTGLSPFFKCQSSFSLKVLICNNNGLGPQGAEEFSKALINCRQLSLSQGGEAFNLKTFVCGRNRMQNKGAMAIANFIKQCETLEEIHMPENSVYWQGQCALASAFAKNPQLRVINLNDNTITGKGIHKLASTFQHLVNLEDLNLGDCLLKSSGALFIVDAIKNHPKLRKLVLDGNEIIKPTGIEIAEILRNSKSLQHLSLSSNPFGLEGSESIRDLLRQCETVEIEDVEDSEYEEEENEEEEGEQSDDDDDDNVENEEGESEEVEDGEIEEDEDYENEDYENSDADDTIEKVIIFLEESSLENYQAIPIGIQEYVYDLDYLGYTSYDVCIQAAVNLVEYYGHGLHSVSDSEECKTIFCNLMTEALNFSGSKTNLFATSLLINLGLFRSEECKFIRNELSNDILEYLTFWLLNSIKEKGVDFPNCILAYLKTAFKNVRPDLSVNASKLASLVDYVLWKRDEVNKNHAPSNTNIQSIRLGEPQTLIGE